MNYLRTALYLTVALLVVSGATLAADDETATQTFDGVQRIKISTVSGDVFVKRSQTEQVTVSVTNAYRPRDSFEPRMEQSGKTLRLSERLFDSNRGGATWVIEAPDGIDLRFSTASGDLVAQDVDGDFSAETASGRVELEDCQGDFDFSTASGDIELLECHGYFDISTASADVDLIDCEGEFDLSTASGEVNGIDLAMTSHAAFSTASGEIKVRLARACEYDLEMSSASGDIVLDYAGLPVQGSFEFMARVNRGRIRSPFDFDHEREVERWDEMYWVKTFVRGSDEPHISLHTASGTVTLDEG